MRARCLVGTLCLLSIGTFTQAKDNSRMKVTVVENLPTTNSYDWEVAGKDTISCYSSGCTSYFTPSGSGTTSVSGAVLKLLLPDGRIVVAECSGKPDFGTNLANALSGAQASTVYRDCRMPEANSIIEAEFNRSQVKLFMQAPSIDGTGRKSSETYYITGVLQPNTSHPAPAPITVTVNNIPPQLRMYSYPADGFSAEYPSEPKFEKGSCPAGTGSAEFHSYTVATPSIGLMVGACDYGVTLAGTDVDEILKDRQNDSLTRSKMHLLSETKISLGAYHGLQFEAENDQGHIAARYYLVGTVLYKTVVVTPTGKPNTDSARFLDSFSLLEHGKSTATQ